MSVRYLKQDAGKAGPVELGVTWLVAVLLSLACWAVIVLAVLVALG